MRENCAPEWKSEVTTNDKDIVPDLRHALAEEVGRERFDLWFGASTWLRFDDDRLTVGVPNRFFLEWIRSSFRRPIEKACLAVLGRQPEVRFQVDKSLPDPNTQQTAPEKTNGPALQVARTQEMAAEETAKESGFAFKRRKLAALDTFVTGYANRLARTSAEMVVREPGRMTPLLIHGPTGVGKTHLLEGICAAARKSRIAGAPIYLSAERFTSDFLEALRGGGLPSFRRKYRSVGMLILDDLHFLAGKRATQIEVMHTVDTMLREGKQLVFAADRPPGELADLGTELISRLESGMVCRIDRPDFATRLGIVEHMARQMKMQVPENVQRFVASRLTGHARELSGALCCLRATSEAHRQPITLPLAEEALGEMIRHSGRAVRLPDIEKAVCDVFGLDPASLQSDRKARQVTHPRMLAMWLARKHTRAALSEIGHFFGGRTHSTVVSAQKRVDDWMADGTALRLADKTWDVDDAIRAVEQQLLAG